MLEFIVHALLDDQIFSAHLEDIEIRSPSPPSPEVIPTSPESTDSIPTYDLNNVRSFSFPLFLQIIATNNETCSVTNKICAFLNWKMFAKSCA